MSLLRRGLAAERSFGVEQTFVTLGFSQKFLTLRARFVLRRRLRFLGDDLFQFLEGPMRYRLLAHAPLPYNADAASLGNFQAAVFFIQLAFCSRGSFDANQWRRATDDHQQVTSESGPTADSGA